MDPSAAYCTMSLGSRGPSTIPNHRRVNRECSVPKDEIEGGRPELRYLRYTNRRPDLYRTSDIEGTSPSILHKKREQEVTIVEGSKPKRSLFKTSRVVDPLDPVYSLPSCEPAPRHVPKFVRDAYDVKDIEGTQPRPMFPFKQRETHDCSDVEGAKAGWKPRHELVRRSAPPIDFYNVKDINDLGFKTKRSTNPLRPVHTINGMTIQDDMVRTMPKKSLKPHQGPFLPLHTQDIDGAQPGWIPPHAMHPPLENRRHFRNINFVGDIPGAQPDTVKYAFRTMRNTNPLNPQYTSLDGHKLHGDPTKPDYSHILKNHAQHHRQQKNNKDLAADVAAVRALP